MYECVYARARVCITNMVKYTEHSSRLNTAVNFIALLVNSCMNCNVNLTCSYELSLTYFYFIPCLFSLRHWKYIYVKFTLHIDKQYVFSDKTGHLIVNQLVLKKIKGMILKTAKTILQKFAITATSKLL